MGTLATFFRRTDFMPTAADLQAERMMKKTAAKTVAKTKAQELAQYKLRALPNDDVYFFCKRIDNSRLVRQADPQSKGQCWSAIGAACVVAVLFGSVMAPKVGTILAGYKVQQLKQERQELLDERKSLEVDEASLLSPARLDELAQKQKLNNPTAGQIVHLSPTGETAFASVVIPTSLKAR
jgi:cell division protein FtsL